jgi:phospholipase/carboxylesterase
MNTKAQAAHLFLFHGLGASGDDLAPVGRMLAEQAGMLKLVVHTPAAPVAAVTVNAGTMMPSWFDIYGLDRDAPVDLVGINAMAERQAALIDSKVGDAPFWVGGFSQGGVVALRAACLTRRVPEGVLLLSTWLPAPEAFVLPADCLMMPIFIGHGDFDGVVSPASAARMAHILADQGAARITQYRYAMEHSICPEELGDMAAWMQNSIDINLF